MLKCLFGRHDYKEEGTGKDDKIVCFCRNCFKIITIEKRIDKYKARAEANDGAPYQEGDYIFIPTYELKREYKHETVVVAPDWDLARKIQKQNTLSELIKQSSKPSKRT